MKTNAKARRMRIVIRLMASVPRRRTSNSGRNAARKLEPIDNRSERKATFEERTSFHAGISLKLTATISTAQIAMTVSIAFSVFSALILPERNISTSGKYT